MGLLLLEAWPLEQLHSFNMMKSLFMFELQISYIFLFLTYLDYSA